MNTIPAADKKERYIQRDLSWLMFNERVLEEAKDDSNPLLERLRFLAIFVSNLDEFFMVRVASFRRLLDAGYDQKERFGYYPHEILAEIGVRTKDLIKELYRIYEKGLQGLQENNIYLRGIDDLNAEQRKFVKRYFESTVFPTITPMAVDEGRPFPVLPSKAMAFAISLQQKGEQQFAVIPVPKNIPRLLKVPSETEESCFVFIEEIIRANLARFFKGFRIKDHALFRVIRDSELSNEEEYTGGLLKAIEQEVKRRPRAKVVYLALENNCSSELLEELCGHLDFAREEVFSVGGKLDLSFLFELIGSLQRPDLCYRGFLPAKIAYENIYDRVKEGDFITHVPFQSFYPTVDLLRRAAQDPDVLAIKMTLYRTNEDSAIIQALKDAAQKKKQVTVLVEIKARFDEERNISWARQLEEAGCHVIYGIPGLKVHSKMVLIVRREEGLIRRYVHLSTGNYNEKTAKVYTDIGYFTGNEDFARDISDVFNVITGYSVPSRWQRVVSSPNDLREYFFGLIDREIAFQKKRKNGQIFAKMNSLEDPQMIDKLYEASQAGVQIRLIVRGICCLVPGVQGLSENIEVKSIVGRFLEHTRIYTFHNNGSPRFFLSSADWMTRNLDRRIELMFEVNKQEIKDHLASLLRVYWQDNVKSRRLCADKTYERFSAEGGRPFNAQDYLLESYHE